MTRAPRWMTATYLTLAVLLLAAVSAVGAFATGLVQLPGTTTRPAVTRSSTANAAAPPSVDADAARVQALRGLLDQRAAAVSTRSKARWMATVDDPRSVFGKRQSQVFDNLMRLPLSRFRFADPGNQPALAPTGGARLGSGAWVAKVQGEWALAGYDRGSRTYDVFLTVVHRAGRWRLADDRDGGTQLQVWDLPGMRVLRGTSSIVIGNAPSARMDAYRTQADGGVARVTDFWGTGWARRVVLVTPSTPGEFAALLNRDRTGLDQVAAVTEGPITRGEPAHADRVVVNPAAWSRLAALGRRVVITHELTHVAIRSTTTGQVPIWLSEGTADYVGYSGLGLPRQRVASELLTRVRQGKGPTRLPTAADFDPTRSTIAPSYSAAWLACSRIADTWGQARLVAFYRAVARATAGGQDPDAAASSAFRTVLGTTQQRFTRDWQTYLRQLART
ncbi:MAG TPA: hypothetical protein VFK66_10070 [Oryzihumus sp.]|nr:hypothetical protein [Oryzihumus sp.]